MPLAIELRWQELKLEFRAGLVWATCSPKQSPGRPLLLSWPTTTASLPLELPPGLAFQLFSRAHRFILQRWNITRSSCPRVSLLCWRLIRVAEMTTEITRRSLARALSMNQLTKEKIELFNRRNSADDASCLCSPSTSSPATSSLSTQLHISALPSRISSRLED